MGDVLYRKTEASFNGRFISDYGTNSIEYMYPVLFDKMCIIAPKALRIPQWTAIFNCFSRLVWAIIVIAVILCGCFWYLLKRWTLRKYKLNLIKHNTKYDRKFEDSSKCRILSIEIWFIMLAGASSHMPFRTVERIFISSCLATNVIIVGTFQVYKFAVSNQQITILIYKISKLEYPNNFIQHNKLLQRFRYI